MYKDKIKIAGKHIQLRQYDQAIQLIDEVMEKCPNLISLKNTREILIRKQKNKYQNELQEYSETEFCIILNTTYKEKDKIERLFDIWNLCYRLNKEKYKEIDFKICFDIINEKQKKEIAEIINKTEINVLFKSIEIISIDVPEKFNFYKRNVDNSLNLNEIVYGYKSGPNYQFFNIFKQGFIKIYSFLLIIETDCYPIVDNWIKKIIIEVQKKSNFWVLGSPFRGRSKIGPEIVQHINGVAVYSVGNPEFFTMINHWEKNLLSLVSQFPEVAYDWSQEVHYKKLISVENWEGMTTYDIQQYLEYRKNFIYSDTIINLAGETERSGSLRYTFKELSLQFPKAVLVHGDYFELECSGYFKKLYDKFK
jgi:hypothetical protein